MLHLVNKFHDFINNRGVVSLVSVARASLSGVCIIHTLNVDTPPFKLPQLTVDIPTFSQTAEEENTFLLYRIIHRYRLLGEFSYRV